MAHRSPLDTQLNDMINELHSHDDNDEREVHTGPFVPMYHSPLRLLGDTRTTTATASSSSLPTTPLANRRNRKTIVALEGSKQKEYGDRTLGVHNFKRLFILPLFPTTNVEISPGRGKATQLLRANVPLGFLTNKLYLNSRRETFPFPFELKAKTQTNNSFLITFYQELYGKLNDRLMTEIPILDFNLKRLHDCVKQVAAHYQLDQITLNVNELASALEFYLQIDVDLFFMKTCSFNGAQPRTFDHQQPEGLFCIGSPQARYAITPCGKSACECCHPPCPRRNSTAIEFSTPYVHRFVNQYEAILNCPATCESKNCIYVLTCPCGQYDFIDESKVSFAETLAAHREEGNRIVREFLIGERNIEYLTQGLKSEQKKANDQSWLYQHSARCSVALQFFLEFNPEYWCFVPTKSGEQQMVHGLARGYLTRQSASHRELPPPSESDLFSTWHRRDAEVRQLVANLPLPPFGYNFTSYQRQQQANFFKWSQDRNVPMHNVDLYDANIVAILPDNVSKLFRKTMASLFITHTECKLNQKGHLFASEQFGNMNPNRTLDSVWCVNLVRPQIQ